MFDYANPSIKHCQQMVDAQKVLFDFEYYVRACIQDMIYGRESAGNAFQVWGLSLRSPEVEEYEEESFQNLATSLIGDRIKAANDKFPEGQKLEWRIISPWDCVGIVDYERHSYGIGFAGRRPQEPQTMVYVNFEHRPSRGTCSFCCEFPDEDRIQEISGKWTQLLSL